MNLTAHKSSGTQLDEKHSLHERVKLACELAKQLEKAGEYEAACEALIEVWPKRLEPPRLDGLVESTKALVLLRVGALTGWLGSADHIEDSQEAAKDRLTQSRDTFHQLGKSHKEAEAHGELALCYWREGALDEARIQLCAALDLLSEEDSELRAVLLIRAGIVEATAGRSNEALRLYEEAADDVERSPDHALKGTFHNSLATLLTRMASVGDRQDYSDRALIEYAAASFHFEQAGNHRYMGRVENCLGYLFFTIRRFEDAHEHLDHAHRVFFQLGDFGMAAHVDETRARVLLAEGRLTEAERVVRSAIRTFERGAHQALLAEALTTHGVIVARMGNYSRARAVLQRSSDIAQTAGDLEGAGRAQLTIIEELGNQTPLKELGAIYRSALQPLVDTQDTTSRKRLISCAGRVITAFEDPDAENQQSEVTSWKDFSFKEHIHNCERVVIERALRDAGGSVTRAATLLGFKHHHSLISLLNTRHKELLKARSIARKRRRQLLSDFRTAKAKDRQGPPSPQRKASQISILHVENSKAAELLDDRLSKEGMHVHPCADGVAAVELLKSDERFNVIIVDNDLPGLSGLELVLRARSLSHRHHTPVILLSGDDCEKEAWRAGVDAFLLKPKGIEQVPSTVARLLKGRQQGIVKK
ncbi:MAG: response regulator [Pyrinomonadaceae bacterium]